MQLPQAFRAGKAGIEENEFGSIIFGPNDDYDFDMMVMIMISFAPRRIVDSKCWYTELPFNCVMLLFEIDTSFKTN